MLADKRKGVDIIKALYQHLYRFGFKSPKGVRARLSTITIEELHEFFGTYQDAVWPDPVIERSPHGQITVLPDGWGTPPPVKMILQLALYIDRAFLHDPILDLMFEWQGLSYHPQYVLRYPDADQRKRAFALQRLEPVLTKLLVLKDLILEGLVILLPTALIGGKHEPGFIYSTDFFGPKGSANDLIGRSHPVERFPESLRRAALDRVSIHPVKADLMGNISPEWNKPLSPARTIALAFPGENQYTIRLLSTVLADPNRDGVIKLYYNPDDPVDVDTFLNWVEGSKADLANERLEVLIRDLTVATLARASFLTPFPTSRDLLEITGPTTQDVILTQILRLNLPYFETVTPRDLLRARKNEAAFHDFRIALEQALQEAAQSSDSRSVEKAIREAVAGPIARVEARMRSLRRTIAINSALLAGTLGVGLFSQQKPLLLIAAIQLLGHYRNLKAAEDQVKESRGYFYWDVTRYAKKRQL